MSIALATLRQRVKNKLKADDRDKTNLLSAINNSDVSALVFIGEGERLSNGDLIQIDAEVMKVKENPIRSTFLGSALGDSDTYMQVDSTVALSAGFLIKIDEEIMQITDLSASSWVSADRAEWGTIASEHTKNTPVCNPDGLRVDRGYQGTSAYGHTVNTEVGIIETWSNEDIDQAVYDAIRYMRPFFYADYRTDIKEWGYTTTSNSISTDSASEWTATNDIVSLTVDTENQKTGASCLSFGLDASQSAATQGTLEIMSSATIDGRSAQYMNMWFYIDEMYDDDSNDEPVLDANALRIRVGNHSGAYYEKMFARDEFHDGWNQLSFPYKQADASGTVQNSSIQYMMLDVYENQHKPVDIAATELRIDDIMFTEGPRMNSKHKIELPEDIFYIGSVRSYAGGDYNELKDFELRDTGKWRIDHHAYDLVFKDTHNEGEPLELIGAQYYEFFDSDSDGTVDTIDSTPEVEEFIALYATKQCIENRLPELLRFDKYSAKTDREDGTRLDYIRALRQYQERIVDMIDHHAKSLDAQRIHWGKGIK